MTIRRVSFVALFLALAGLVAVPNSAMAQEEEERAPMGGQESFTQLIDALNNSEEQVQALKQQDIQNVDLVNVEDLRQGLDDTQKQRLDEAMDQANTDELHQALEENQTVQSALEEETQDDVSVDDVVAVNASGEGNVVLYYDPSTF